MADIQLFLQTHTWMFGIVGIIGLLYSVTTGWFNSKKQVVITSNLVKLANQISTRHLGTFPGHVKEIAQIVETAIERIEVVTDCVDYGSFSAPPEHGYLWHTLLSLLHRPNSPVSVEFLIEGTPKTISIANRLSNPATHREPEFTRSVDEFLKGLLVYASGFVDGHRAEYDALRALADDPKTDWLSPNAIAVRETLQSRLHQWEVDHLRAGGAKITIGPDDLSGSIEVPSDLFFWIVDRRRAVFLLTCPGTDAIAFITNDTDLVGRLVEIFIKKSEKLVHS